MSVQFLKPAGPRLATSQTDTPLEKIDKIPWYIYFLGAAIGLSMVLPPEGGERVSFIGQGPCKRRVFIQKDISYVFDEILITVVAKPAAAKGAIEGDHGYAYRGLGLGALVTG